MITNIKNYFVSSYEEMRKVIWPSRKEVTSHTIIVVLSIIIGMAIIALIDWALLKLLEFIIYKG